MVYCRVHAHACRYNPKIQGVSAICTEHVDETAYSLTPQFCFLASLLLQFIFASETVRLIFPTCVHSNELD